MRKVLSSLFVAMLVIACAVDYSFAQRQGGPGGQGRGPGMMGRGGGAGDTVADALVLTDERAEKVNAAYAEARESMQGNMGDFQNMTREERMTAFTEMREKMQKATLEKLATVLTKDELEAVKPLLNARGGRTVAEVRALRQIEIDKATRGKLQTVVLIYMNTVAALTPQFQPGQRPQPGQGGRGMMSEEDQKKVEAARESLLADIKKILNDDQEKAWVAQTAKVQEEMDNRRQQFQGQRGQRGQGGQGGQRGQGQ